MVIAAIASTTGTALGSTQGSWRPRAVSVVAFPLMSTVSCSRSRVATGLKATRKQMSCPLEIPPCIPPLWLVAVVMSDG